tara:strand:- start:968 stop:8455 length:7488 start_codon:yes stop_codon:yes gene_type:complete
MAIVKKYNELLDLDDIDVLVDEVDKSQHIILSDLPDSLPQGKSSFLIETSPFMKDGTELQMDFIDNDGASIYLEPVSEYLEGTARRVSAEIYEDTAPGIATLIIVGELEMVPEDKTIFSDVESVPAEYEGAYNVRLTKQIVINPTAVNTEIIKFWTQPKITVFEQRKGTMTRSEETGSIYSPPFNIEGLPTDSDLLFKPYGGIDSDIQQGDVGGGTSSPKKQRNVKAYIESKKRKNRKGLRKNSAFKRSGLLSKTNSPATFPYQLKIGDFDGTESFRFNTAHIGGTVEFQASNLGNTFGSSSFYPTDIMQDAGLLETPTFDTLKEQGITNVSASNYTASIVDLINDKTAVVELPFTNKNENGENVVLPIFSKARIAYENMPTGSYAVANIVSYADVRLANMKTFSGDVYKSKVYVKSEGGFDDYKLLAEVPLEGKELLVDDASVGMGERTGYVIMQSEIDSYWDLKAGTNGLSAVSGDAVATYDNSVMLDSIHLSGSVGEIDKDIKLQLKDAYKFNLVKGIDYTISFNAIGERDVSDTTNPKDAVIIVYISGSSMHKLDNLYYDEINNRNVEEPNEYGKRIGSLRVSLEDDNILNFGLVNQPFASNLDGDGVLQFRVISGKWNIGDISVQPGADTGFSPSFFQFIQQMPAELGHKRPDTFEFLAEFYDVNNNIADTIAYNPSTVFTGANLTITGEDNVLESNLFIGGETTASGIHLGGVSSTVPETGGAGAAGSGFMRTVGYQGFKSASDAGLGGKYGFMFWSGSVLPDSGDNYDGVGLELVGPGGSFTFKTNPSVFDVRADAFFVGKTTTQFISGSNENIEISSSGFHLSPEGNVTASAILIGDKGNNTFLQFTDNKLTVEAESFFVGNSTSQFISGSNNNIEVSSSEFHLTPQGNVTASAILLGDKANAQFLQFNNGQLTVQGNISVDSIRTPALIDGSPSTALNASSSIDPNGLARFTSASIAGFTINTEEIKSTDNSLRLKQIGQITGSKVLFTGGEIGGFTISSTQLSGGDDSDFIGLTPGTGIQMGDSTFSDAPFSVTNGGFLKATSGTIAGWSLTNQQITGGNLVLDKGGFIKSADYISDISGFIITAQENGYAEFENCRIRGTLATTTFEKESVNAVGGQMFIANSAALSGSNVNASEVSMSLMNVTGFTRGEILLIKKVGNTGFNTEYAKVISSSRTSDGGDDDPDGLAGELYVQRGHGFYTRSVRDFVFNSGGSGTQRTFSNGTVYPLNYVNVGQSYSSGDVNGFDVSAGVTHTGSFHIYVTGSVSQSDVGDGTAVDFQLLNNSNSDSLIGTRRLWQASDGDEVRVQSDLYFSVNDLTPMPTSSKIKAQLVVSTDGTNDQHVYLTKFTASLDYGIIGSIELGESGSVGDPIGGPQDYKEGQVVVSTGRYISGTGSNTVGSGYIRLNANPKNAATPYMDIVERTGSGIYDVELKTRVGDLSGVAGTRNVPENFTGFGIMSEVAFLSGSNIKLEAPTFVLGDLNSAFVSGSNSNIEISSSKFHLQNDGQLIFGNKSTNNYIEWNNSTLAVRGDLAVDRLFTPATIEGASSNATNASSSIDQNGNVRFVGQYFLGKEGKNFISGSNENLEISSSKFHLKPNGDLVIGYGSIGHSTPSQNIVDQQAHVGDVDNENHAYLFVGAAGTSATGSTVTDTGDNNSKVHLNAQGGVTYSSDGILGTSLHFDGTAQVASSQTTTFADNPETGFTITLWMKAEDVEGNFCDTSGDAQNIALNHLKSPLGTTTKGGNQIVFGLLDDGDGFMARISGSHLYVTYHDGAPGTETQFIKSNTTLQNDRWYHIQIMFNRGGRDYIYINGEEDIFASSESTDLGSMNSNQLSLGSGASSYSNGSYYMIYNSGGSDSVEYFDNTTRYRFPFKGSIDDFRFYTTPLSEAQAKSLYASYFTEKFGSSLVYDSANSLLDLNSKNFYLGTGGHTASSGSSTPSFISGSGGKLEIFSENFHLKRDGSVSMRGQVRADSGVIGGFTLTNGHLSGDNTGTAKISTSPSGKRVQIDGSDNSLTFFSGSTGTEVMTLSDNEYVYLIIPDSAGDHRFPGVKLSANGSLLLNGSGGGNTNGATGRQVGVIIPMPTVSNPASVSHQKHFVGIATTHPGPSNITNNTSGNTMGASFNFSNTGDGNTYGVYNLLYLGSGGGAGFYSKTLNNTVTNDVTNTGIGIIGAYLENDQDTDGETVRMLAVKTGQSTSGASQYGLWMNLDGDVDGTYSSYGAYIDTAGVSTGTGINYGLFTTGGDYDKHENVLWPSAYIFGEVSPVLDDAYDLGGGTGTRRWDDVFATNGTINTSDRNLKTQISGSDLGLSFINKLNPVKYKWISGSNSLRYHYGLIAQEVSESLNASNVTTDNFAGYVTDDVYRRTQLNYVSHSVVSEISSSIKINDLEMSASNYNVSDFEIEFSESIEQSKNKILKNPKAHGSLSKWEYKSSTTGLRYNEFIAPLIKSVQELTAEVRFLRGAITGSTDLNDLKSKVSKSIF